MPGIREATESLCPHCLARIPARRVSVGDEVVLEKLCPEHGSCRTVIWRGRPSFGQWKRPKPVAKVAAWITGASRGCPFDCGICPEHRQIGCTALLEVTQRCNLACPVCFADSGGAAPADPGLEVIDGWLRKVMQVEGRCSIQFSGGEPTVREDLPTANSPWYFR